MFVLELGIGYSEGFRPEYQDWSCLAGLGIQRVHSIWILSSQYFAWGACSRMFWVRARHLLAFGPKRFLLLPLIFFVTSWRKPPNGREQVHSRRPYTLLLRLRWGGTPPSPSYCQVFSSPAPPAHPVRRRYARRPTSLHGQPPYPFRRYGPSTSPWRSVEADPVEAAPKSGVSAPWPVRRPTGAHRAPLDPRPITAAPNLRPLTAGLQHPVRHWLLPARTNWR
jgi:hypothetical protein